MGTHQPSPKLNCLNNKISRRKSMCNEPHINLSFQWPSLVENWRKLIHVTCCACFNLKSTIWTVYFFQLVPFPRCHAKCITTANRLSHITTYSWLVSCAKCIVLPGMPPLAVLSCVFPVGIEKWFSAPNVRGKSQPSTNGYARASVDMQLLGS